MYLLVCPDSYDDIERIALLSSPPLVYQYSSLCVYQTNQTTIVVCVCAVFGGERQKKVSPLFFRCCLLKDSSFTKVPPCSTYYDVTPSSSLYLKASSCFWRGENIFCVALRATFSPVSCFSHSDRNKAVVATRSPSLFLEIIRT